MCVRGGCASAGFRACLRTHARAPHTVTHTHKHAHMLECSRAFAERVLHAPRYGRGLLLICASPHAAQQHDRSRRGGPLRLHASGAQHQGQAVAPGAACTHLPQGFLGDTQQSVVDTCHKDSLETHNNLWWRLWACACVRSWGGGGGAGGLLGLCASTVLCNGARDLCAAPTHVQCSFAKPTPVHRPCSRPHLCGDHMHAPLPPFVLGCLSCLRCRVCENNLHVCYAERAALWALGDAGHAALQRPIQRPRCVRACLLPCMHACNSVRAAAPVWPRHGLDSWNGLLRVGNCMPAHVKSYVLHSPRRLLEENVQTGTWLSHVTSSDRLVVKW